MKVSASVIAEFRGKVAAPTIYLTNDIATIRRVHADHGYSGMVIPRFGMFATYTPKALFEKLLKEDWIEAVFIDRQLGVPELDGAQVLPSIGLQGRSMSNPFPLFRQVTGFAKGDDGDGLFTKILGRGGDDISDFWPTGESLKALEADLAHAEGITGRGVKIAIIDSDAGRRCIGHPQLAGKAQGFTLRKMFLHDTCGHGGHCACTAAGKEILLKNGLMVKGVAPDAQVLMIKVLNSVGGMGSTSDILRGIAYALDKGCQVISMSLGGDAEGSYQDDPFYLAGEKMGDMVARVTAGGNSGPGDNTIGSPGHCPNYITVGARDRNGSIADFSSRGPTNDALIKPDVVAPGVKIYSGLTPDTLCDFAGAPKTRGYAELDGTSMATPHIAGFIALLIQAGLWKGNAAFKDRMENAAGSKDSTRGWGEPKWTQFRGG